MEQWPHGLLLRASYQGSSSHAGVRALGDVEREDGDVVAVEGANQREQLEEQHAQRPDVGGLAIRLGLD